MSVEFSRQRRDSARNHLGVRIEQMNIFGRLVAPCQGQHRLIVRPAKAAVDRQRQERHPVPIFGTVDDLPKRRHRPVTRTAIDDNRSQIRQQLLFGPQRSEAARGESGLR